MTPADEIRTAAEKLRALATAAADNSGSSTWHATRHFPDQPDSTFTTLWATGARPLLGGGGRGRVPYVHAPVGNYAAAMDPAVGLLLTDLLDDLADGDDEGVVNPWALAVARALNKQ
ncbi:hypothetical protein [Streptomyces rubradiris]|uniref:Uncharacterized protein n=1 Tax=Streptomyces rubradiris TaxID=285531 RepID=A0ABQ3R3F0_STRRR|nr:hypothetical protein [Streptomyces rubradiris]GHH30096.1 hypothetical protein GCM10018792_76090 [Streptomyces rubradiris]GHI50390.1 hypothetical protein Srubr_02360 [Streptomyces rubradiris]